jgi:hypothetical protein
MDMINLRTKCGESRYLSINHQRQVDLLMKQKFHLHTKLTIRLPNNAIIEIVLSNFILGGINNRCQ